VRLDPLAGLPGRRTAGRGGHHRLVHDVRRPDARSPRHPERGRHQRQHAGAAGPVGARRADPGPRQLMPFRLTGAAPAVLPAAAFVLAACGEAPEKAAAPTEPLMPPAANANFDPEPLPLPDPDRIDSATVGAADPP